MNQAAEQRFWNKVDLSAGPDGCWPWLAARARGYGRFLWDGKLRQAHQVAYELVTGEPLGALHLGHTCHNKPCCNPQHLRTTTQKRAMRIALARSATAAAACGTCPVAGGAGAS